MLDALAAESADDQLLLRTPGRVASKLLFGSAALVGRPRLGAGADVFWLPAPAPIAIAADVPYVLTVHDLSWEERPADFTRYERLYHRLARPERQARGAAAVVAVSEATRDVVAERWGVEARVIHSGVPDLPAPDPTGLPPLPDRFVLAVGAIEPRKDPLLLVAAHAEARRRGLDAGLVFAGDGPLAEAVAPSAPGDAAPGGGAAAVRVRPSGPQLAWLYASALALAMPSRLEGFGFPPLEAARAGTPSVVSDLPVFRETLGDGATYVPPGDVDAWAAALVRAGAGGLPVADVSRFSWRRAAHELHAVLEEAAA